MKSVAILLLAFLWASPAVAQLGAAESVVQGDPLICLVRSPEEVDSLSLELLSAEKKRVTATVGFLLDVDPSGVVYGGVLGVGSGIPAGRYVLRAKGSADGYLFRYSLPIKVEAKDFARETIALDGALTDLLKVEDPEKTKQSQQLNAILNSVDPAAVYHTQAFSPPVTEIRRTSGFGDIRCYHYHDGEKQYRIHAGIDYGVAQGTPVYACAAGKVSLAMDRIITGYSVVIEHLPGLYSVYYHLSALAVHAGEMVTIGQKIGESGSTGLATGPHLHWEVRAAGVAVNPDAFLPQTDAAGLESENRLLGRAWWDLPEGHTCFSPINPGFL